MADRSLGAEWANLKKIGKYFGAAINMRNLIENSVENYASEFGSYLG